MTDDHLPRPNPLALTHPFLSGRVTRIFIFERRETSLLGLKGYSHQPNLSMTPEEAYEEALRRIRKAEETGARELDLSRLELTRAGERARF